MNVAVSRSMALVFPKMANPVPSACCVVLTAVVVVYAQRHSQQDSHIQYERVGADVTMKCGSMDWDAAVTWTANGTDIDESHLNGSYLILKNVDLTQSGQYSCYEGSSWHLKYQTYLRVGIKPDPPESVVAKPVPNNPRRLEVSWQNPSSWPDPDSFPLKFFLRYRPLILDQWQHVELSDGTSHTITDAYAGKEYIIQVAAKDNDIGTWSDWSVAVHATPWTEEPKHLTTEAQITETTSASSSSFMPPPTTKICDKGAVVGSGAVAVCWTAGLVLAAYGVLFI
nr:ciliary neurotrophic factor receptor subunit alpha isoform X1 [Columba livia]XP_021150653.1 ciliary neurotrophic factor receptor subunit alpha isoform X1 [Columba livia]XP_021150654.1 ciliary neurotrophic factor receptor subunit alpha isoform X1 [Columba livia]XP_021150655.1 ciliary neurotrophic factor receptor subunit alpha isoform X1 [Columba livia]XP_021150656.1 ciliary neurotrophic factor receptor subunit alpha isoform X2 [Columba livia]XP_021150657.1 ciliary neurotrophic factor recepto